jgi:hypothetical protein
VEGGGNEVRGVQILSNSIDVDHIVGLMGFHLRMGSGVVALYHRRPKSQNHPLGRKGPVSRYWVLLGLVPMFISGRENVHSL